MSKFKEPNCTLQTRGTTTPLDTFLGSVPGEATWSLGFEARGSIYPLQLPAQAVGNTGEPSNLQQMGEISFSGEQPSSITLSAKTFLTIPFWERVG